MQESEWLTATQEIRSVFGQRMRSTDSFELVDVLLPVGRTGIEVSKPSTGTQAGQSRSKPRFVRVC